MSDHPERLVLAAKGAAWYAVAIMFGIELIILVPFLMLQGGGTFGSFFFWMVAAVVAIAVWVWLLNIANRLFDQARRDNTGDTTEQPPDPTSTPEAAS